MAQALAKVGAVVGSQEVLPCLKHLLDDPDTDVRFYAAESIELLKEGGSGGDEAIKTKMDTSGDGAGNADNAPNPAILASA